MKYYCRLCGDELSDSNKCKAHIISEFIWREYMEYIGVNKKVYRTAIPEDRATNVIEAEPDNKKGDTNEEDEIEDFDEQGF